MHSRRIFSLTLAMLAVAALTLTLQAKQADPPVGDVAIAAAELDSPQPLGSELSFIDRPIGSELDSPQPLGSEFSFAPHADGFDSPQPLGSELEVDEPPPALGAIEVDWR